MAMACRSKAANPSVTNINGWYMMHGSSSPTNKKGWKNELFGDGHCESRRMDQMKERYAPNNPNGW